MTKNVFITGASKGIGFSLLSIFLENNYRVFGTSRSGEIPDLPHKNFEAVKLDLSKNESINELQKFLEKRKPAIDILVNNAGIGPDLGASEPNEKTMWDTINVNVIGTTFLTETILPYINRGGKIINISSKMGSINFCEQSDSPAYRMSKSALNMYTKMLTNRLRGKYTIASVHPGWVRTTISENSSKHGRLSPQESAKRIFEFIGNDFASGSFWDVENQMDIEW